MRCFSLNHGSTLIMNVPNAKHSSNSSWYSVGKRVPVLAPGCMTPSERQGNLGVWDYSPP